MALKVAITGGTGFVGAELVQKHLALGDEVHVLSRQKAQASDGRTHHHGDLSDVRALERFVRGSDILYHAAAEIRDELKMQRVNVEGTRNLLQVASGRVGRWVQLSSVGVYGPVQSGLVNECHGYRPGNTYEKTKLESDRLVQASKGVPYTLIRPSNVFGPTMTNASLFGLVHAVDRGFYFHVGPRGASANYISAANVVHALYLAATHPKATRQIYNVSAWCTMEEFVGHIASSLGKPSPSMRLPVKPIEFLARATRFLPNNPLTLSRVRALSNRSVYSTQKIEDELHYRPIESTKTAIECLVRVYRARK